MTAFTGGCLCGNVRYRADAEPLWLCHCHCSTCRKQTGSPATTWVGFPAGTVSWLAAMPTRYRSSDDVERSFCPICGSTIGFHRAHETSLAVGGFDAPDALPGAGVSTMHVWFKEHLPWFDTADDWPRHAEFPAGRTEDALIAALRVKAAHPDAAITYVRKQNVRGDRRHPHARQATEDPAEPERG